MLPSADEADIQEGAAAYSENVDPHGREGILTGIPQDGSARNNPRFYRGGWINDGGQSDLVYLQPGGAIYKIENWYVTSASTGTTLSTGSGSCLVVHNKDAHIGRGDSNPPHWVGYVSTGASGLQSETAVLGGEVTANKPSASSFVGGTVYKPKLETVVNKDPGYKVFVKYSYLYDGYQEGPIDSITGVVGSSVNMVVDVEVDFDEVNANGTWLDKEVLYDSAGDPVSPAEWVHHGLWYGYDITLTATNSDPTLVSGSGTTTVLPTFQMFRTTFGLTLTAPSSWPDRVTHLNFYAAFNHSGDLTATEPDSYYRLVQTFARADLATPQALTVTADTVLGATYLASSGRAESLDEVTPRWSLATGAGAYHIIANCSLAGSSDDLQNYLLRSQPMQFDCFNWPTDHLRLNLVPKAIAFYQGRLYVFADNLIYRVNPHTFVVEDELQGVTVSGQDDVLTTEFGMFITDRQNVYVSDGTRLVQIGTPILYNEYDATVAYVNRDVSTTRMGFDPKRNLLLVSADDSAANAVIWSYHIPTQRWDVIRPTAAHVIEGFLGGPRGELFWSQYNGVSNNFVDFATSATTRTFTWVSPILYMGNVLTEKAFYKVTVVTNTAPGATTVQYRTTRTGSWTNCSFSATVTNTYEAVLGSGAVSTGWSVKSNMIQLRVNGATNQKIYELGVTFRAKQYTHQTY